MSYTPNPKLNTYLQALREATGEQYELAVGHLRLASKELTPEKIREIESGGREEKKKLLDSWFGNYLVGEVKNLLTILAEDGSLDLLKELQRDEERREAVVKTPNTLDEETKSWLREELEKQGGVGRVVFRKDPSLIGGVQIKIGDKEVDNSIKTRLGAIFS